jgi:hypothetical protein
MPHMNEQQPKSPYEGLTDEQIAQYEAYMTVHPETPVSPEDLRNPEEETAELEALIANFEQAHDIEGLRAITNLTPEEAPRHPTREPARKDLVPIVGLLNALKEETNIPEEKYEELKARYRNLSRAVGLINGGVVDHTR